MARKGKGSLEHEVEGQAGTETGGLKWDDETLIGTADRRLHGSAAAAGEQSRMRALSQILLP